MNETGLELTSVRKQFAGFRLGPITTAFRPGRAYGLLGPNGAGKTTLLNLIALQLRASEGTISFNGSQILWGDVAWKERFSYIRETPVFYDELSVSATMALASELYDKWDEPLATELVRRFRLDQGKVVGTLSKGNRVKLGLVLALAHRAELLLLDEPTAGLDPTARADLQAALLNLMTDMPRLALVLSSHIFEDIERVTDEIVIIRDGHLVFQGDVDSLAKGGTTVAELYHATEHLCKPGKP